MEKIATIVIGIAGFLNGIAIIMDFIARVKKPVDKVVDNKFKEALEPINEKLDSLNGDIKKLDKNQCMDYLVEFIEDSKNGIPKDEIQKKRASEVYDHYRNDLHLNTYIHDGWETYVNKGV